MDITNAILKRHTSFSLLELFLFVIFGLGLYYVFQLSWVFPFLNSPVTHQKDINSFPVNFFFIIFWFLLFFIFKRVAIGVYKYLISFRKYTFKSSDWPKKWNYQGNIRLGEPKENCLYVTDSNSGCILKHHFWKNLEISFKCRFMPQTEEQIALEAALAADPTNESVKKRRDQNKADDQTFGIIFRAKSLSDYLMIQINEGRRIVPHIHMEGRWETTRLSTYNLNSTLERGVFINFKLRVLDEKVELFIEGDTKLEWIIPTNSDLQSADLSKIYIDAIVPRIDFRTGYGRVGFRAYQGECAVIKHLQIKRLPGIL